MTWIPCRPARQRLVRPHFDGERPVVVIVGDVTGGVL